MLWLRIETPSWILFLIITGSGPGIVIISAIVIKINIMFIFSANAIAYKATMDWEINYVQIGLF